jgi:hypothetical protein
MKNIFLCLAVLGSIVDTSLPHMEEEAIITAVHPATTRSLGEGLEIDSLHVSFRVVQRAMYDDQINKAILKKPQWLSELQPSAPPDGYLMEHGQFTVELAKDDRIKQDLGVTIEVTDI